VLDNVVVFTWLRSNRTLIALTKNTARLFTTRAAARMNFHDCMIFSNFQISNLHVFFEMSTSVMHVMLARSRERARLEPDYFCMEVCMEAQNGLCLPGCPSQVSRALAWT
jgi:hypothetical protein